VKAYKGLLDGKTPSPAGGGCESSNGDKSRGASEDKPLDNFGSKKVRRRTVPKTKNKKAEGKAVPTSNEEEKKSDSASKPPNSQAMDASATNRPFVLSATPQLMPQSRLTVLAQAK